MGVTRVDNTGLRVAAAAGLVIATVIHLMVGGFGGVLPVLFLLSGLGTAAGAVLLFVRPRTGWLVGGAVAGLTALGYVLRSTVGLPPLIPNGVGFWTPPSGAVSAIVEIAVAALAVWVLTDRSGRTADRVR